LEIAFSEGGDRIITHIQGQIIRVWDTNTFKLLHTIHTYLPEKRNARGEIKNGITFSANMRFAFASNGDNFGPASLWSLADGTLLRKYQLPQSNWISAMPQDDGKALFVISNGDLYRWPGAPQELLDKLPVMDKPGPN
jgi:WD40 repeat protein